MSEQSKLNEQLEVFIESYATLKEKNEALDSENDTLREEVKAQAQHIIQIEEELGMKEIESDDLIEKIKQVIG
jgi:hypothetical protein